MLKKTCLNKIYWKLKESVDKHTKHHRDESSTTEKKKKRKTSLEKNFVPVEDLVEDAVPSKTSSDLIISNNIGQESSGYKKVYELFLH